MHMKKYKLAIKKTYIEDNKNLFKPKKSYIRIRVDEGGSVAEWLACWTQAQKGPGSNRSRDAVG